MNYRDTMNINSEGHLQIGGVDAVDLVKKYGTPLYVMDESYIRNVCRAFRETVENTYGEGGVAYASKAFSCKAIYEIAKQENMYIDVVSGGEIYTANSVGFDMKKAYFHGNNKLPQEIALALETGVGTFVIDSFDEIDLLDDMSATKGVVQKVLVRVNPGVEAHTHSFIQTAKVDSKFGFGVKNGYADKAIDAILCKSNLRFAGLHCHIGSQIFDKQAFALAVDVVTDYVVKLKERNIIVDELNFGVSAEALAYITAATTRNTTSRNIAITSRCSHLRLNRR